MKRKILLAMSGGVDSSAAAFLLRKNGDELVGGMMKLLTEEIVEGHSPHYNEGGRSCCTLSDAEDARNVANSLGMPFYVFNFSEAFLGIMDSFVAAYGRGETPNPCIECNRYMKFEKFLFRAAELECDFIATGHYARIEKDADGRFLLKKGVDDGKDQSYVLYAMTQEQLGRTLFPLGGMTKEEVREIAQAQGLINAKKRDSQDICFVPDGDYAGFIQSYTGKAARTGNFINKSGEILGEHRGIINYTVGQRKGLGLSAPNPLFVTRINAEENTVTLGASEELFTNRLTAADINLIPVDSLNSKLRVQAKIRYAHAPQSATIFQASANEIVAEFDTPQRAITPGQAVVFYDGDIVIGGGTILQ